MEKLALRVAGDATTLAGDGTTLSARHNASADSSLGAVQEGDEEAEKAPEAEGAAAPGSPAGCVGSCVLHCMSACPACTSPVIVDAMTATIKVGERST